MYTTAGFGTVHHHQPHFSQIFQLMNNVAKQNVSHIFAEPDLFCKQNSVGG